MALAVWQATIVDASGNVQGSAQIEVRREATGALASIYEDRDGETPLENPFTADEDGFARFYSAGGALKITATLGEFSRTWRHVPIGLLSELDELDQVLSTAVKYPRTAAEIAAGVTPLSYHYPPGHVYRYGAAIQAAINQAARGVSDADARAVSVPQGAYTIDTQRLTISTDGVTLRGDGYFSQLKLPSGGSTFSALLVQHATFQPLKGIKIKDLMWDGADSGQLSAGLLIVNNAQGIEITGNWVQGSTRTAGTDGVNGISMSAGTYGGAGTSGLVGWNYVTGASKAAINYTTECDGATIFANFARSGAGTGITPGIQVNGGFRARVIANQVNNNEGRGIYLATDSGDNPPLYALVAFNHSYGNGQGNPVSDAEGDGIALLNSQAGSTSTGARALIAYNFAVDNGVNTATGTRSGVRVSNEKKVDVVGNYVAGNYLHGIIVQESVHDCDDIRLINNVCENNNLANNAAGAGVFLIGNLNRVEIRGNTIRNVDGVGKQKYGVYIDNSSVIADLVVRDNECQGMETAEYYFGSGGATITRMDLDFKMRKQTTDGNQQTLIAIPIVDNTAVMVEIESVAQKSGGGAVAVYRRVACVYRASGAATVQGGAQTSLAQIESDAAYDASISVTGNLAVVLLTGKAGDTVNWVTRVKVLSVV